MHFCFPPPLRGWAVRWFARYYHINEAEAEKPLGDYHSIGELFTRRLKIGTRPIQGEYVHPVDGLLMQRGQILKGDLLQIKKKSYSLNEFLASSEERKWEEGSYFNYYLCPTDYHRVHSPLKGVIESVTYIPGNLWPVNEWSVNHVSRLFARNERLVIRIKTEKGEVALVMVGATNVGKMTLAFDPKIVTNQLQNRQITKKVYEHTHPTFPGQELGTFHMGSTVIVLYPPAFFDSPVKFDRFIPVRMGESILSLFDQQSPRR